jgi:succinate dehydrogenase / fumarate reductase flavoprotein subunit
MLRKGTRTVRAALLLDHTYDVVVVGAGGATSGLRADVPLCGHERSSSYAGLKTACITKVFPTRSHTVAAQGGIAASLGNMGAGPLALAHVRHRQGLGLARRPGRDRIYGPRGAGRGLRARAWGVPFSRTDEGKIYQRAFGGMMQNMGEGPPAQRTCAAADRTGHAMLHTLYQQSLRYDAEFFIEYFALDLIMEDGACRGVVALCLEDGTIHRFRRTRWCSRPAATAAPISPAPRRIPAPATAAAWCCAPACRCRTWSSSSSTRPASTAPAC